ncbi:MAG: pyridoxamine 5'-phosphate oxidase family protein [Nitrospinae bacterium]|nr:pyridoxamine 5'-phosphate oxidase family protein [Nitrospinota bacterium]
MKNVVSDIAFTPAVKSVQHRMGSRKGYARMEDGAGWKNRIDPDLESFIAERDSFYLSTATADGQPYIQHRGGPKGFLKVLDDHTLAFADFAGNRQYITAGNFAENDKAFIFLMDYANRQRIKIWGTAEVLENDPTLLNTLNDPNYKGQPERVIRFHVEAWDVNCPQHIKPRYHEEDVAQVVQKFKNRIAELETENEALCREAQGVSLPWVK